MASFKLKSLLKRLPACRTLYFKLIEECIAQIVLNKSGVDPDFGYRRLIQLDVEALLAKMQELYGPDSLSHAGSDSLDGSIQTPGGPGVGGPGAGAGTSQGPQSGSAQTHAQSAKLWGSRSELHKRLDEALTSKGEYEARIASLENKLHLSDHLIHDVQEKVPLRLCISQHIPVSPLFHTLLHVHSYISCFSCNY